MANEEQIFANPTRGYIINLSTGEERQWFMNPETVDIAISSDYSESATFSMSQEELNFKSTKLEPFSLTFFVSRFLTMRRIKSNYRDAQKQMEDFRNFLISLTLPDGQFVKEGYVGAQPPSVLVDWPNLFTKTCKVQRVGFSFQLFNRDASERVYSAKVDFKEIRFSRVWSEEAKTWGLSL